MTQFRIRPPQAHDWPALRQLFLESRIAAFHWTDIRRFQLQDLDAQTSGENILLAEDAQGQLAGFISVQSESRFIHHLYVAATHQRLGIGAALLQQLPQWQQEPWQLKCLQFNQPAVNFYMAQGFSVMESGDCDDGAYWLMQSPTN